MNKPPPRAMTQAYAPFLLRCSRAKRKVDFPLEQPHPWGCWLLVLVEEGVLHWETPKKERSIGEGRILLLPPSSKGGLRPHHHFWCRSLEFDLLYRERVRHYKQSWRPLEPEKRVQQGFYYLFGKGAPRIIPGPLSETLKPLVRRITNRWWRSDLDSFQCNTLLAQLMGQILEWHLEQPSNRDGMHPLAPAEAAAREGFSHGCTVQDMARAVGMSREAFTMAYREWRGKGPGAFLRDLRYEQAKALLSQSYSLEDVVRNSGFRSLRTFCRSFTQREGMTPSDWRRNHEI